MKKQIAEYVISLYRDISMVVYEGLLSVLCLVASVIIARYGLKRGWRGIAGLLLKEYIFLLYCSTVFFRIVKGVREYYYTPFWSYDRPELQIENIMNVVAFVPVGSLLGCTIRGSNWQKVLLIGGCLSVFIELLQLVLKKGLSETDDVMHNTLGCMIGFEMYSLVRVGYERISERTLGVLKTSKLE